MTIYKITLAYDKKNEDDPVNNIVKVLLEAEAKEIHLVLFTTLEFQLDVENGEEELSWVLEEITKRIMPYAYTRAYVYSSIFGNGKTDIGTKVNEFIRYQINGKTIVSFRDKYSKK